MIERIIPTDDTHWKKLRLQDITSTEVSALFGLSPYSTKFELWHRKKDQVIVNIKENDRMKWGKRLESSIAKGLAEDNSWEIRPFKEYVRDTELRIGSSFDFAVVEKNVAPKAPVDVAILEIKNVDGLQFKNGWEIDDQKNITAPNHIEIQVQHQLALTGLPVAHIGVLIGGNDVRLIKREPDQAVIKKIKAEVAKFWESIEKNQPPAPDFAEDADFIAKLYGFAEPGKLIQASEQVRQLIESYKHFGDMAKEAMGQKEAAKAEILTLIGDAEKVKGETFTISAGMVGPATISYEREGYRTFKVTFKKTK